MIKRLLSRDPDQRLGKQGGAAEILSHPWFASVDQEALIHKRVKPPYIPNCNSFKHFNASSDPVDMHMTMIDDQAVKLVMSNQTLFSTFDSSRKH